MGNESLGDAIEAQAQAWIDGDLARFASYTTPRVVLNLRDIDMRGARSYHVIDLDATETTGRSKVRYAGRGEFVLEQRWQRIDGLWKVVHAELLGTRSRPWWRKLLPGRARPAAP